MSTETRESAQARLVAVCGDIVELLLVDPVHIELISNCYAPTAFPRSPERELYALAVMLWHGHDHIPELGRWLQVCESADQRQLLLQYSESGQEKRLFRLLGEQQNGHSNLPKYVADLLMDTSQAVRKWQEHLEWSARPALRYVRFREGRKVDGTEGEA
jgi:hypothetical protein